MDKVSIYIENITLVKTNIDFNSPQEEVIYKSNKSKDSNKNINNENAKNISNRNIKENDEKNKEDKNKNNINEINNEQIIIEKKINENNKDNNVKKEVFNDNIKNVIEEEKNEEDPLITYIQSNRKISDEEIKNSSKLILEEIDGNLFNGKNIEINAGGMVDGRNKKDGFTIFGQKNILNEETDNQKQLVNNNNDIFVPDYELNTTKLLFYPYIFAIYYKKEDKSYHIRAYSGKGSDNKILFIKLYNENKYILKQKEIISAGNIIFQVSPIENNCLEIINLTHKKAINNKQIFPGIHNKIVTIGRHKDCDFFFPKDKSFSRYQTTFQYDETKKEWSVIDGKDNKGSTNGTWIFGTHSFLIKKEMIVEILNSKIKITEIKSDNIDNK